ncbi:MULTISPECIES: hypothetical protein [Streptomyces]|uniref:DUF1707 domain-containing protein n=1 Tax=Streptomyces luteosporeus TaxID=173856 RepID=A0ABP6G7D8_9ACTN
MGSTERELGQEHQRLRKVLGERYALVSGLDQDDAAFDAEYGQLVSDAQRLIDFERQLPARLAEPQRERNERFVRWSWRGQSAVAAALILTVFVLGISAWWLVLLVPHLLATLAGWSVKVTPARHVQQRRTAAGLHVLGLLVALVSLGVLSAWFIIGIVIGWLVVGVACDGSEPKGGSR